MIHKSRTLLLAALALTGVLSGASELLAFAQSQQGASERQSTETERKAETLFEEALRLGADRDSEPSRLQMKGALRLWTQLRQPEKAAKALARMGDRCSHARKYQDALTYYRQALELGPVPRAFRANVLNAIGRVYADLYVRDLAARYFNEALEQARIANDLSGQRIALTGLGEVHRQRGELDEAWVLITKALRLSKPDRAGADPALLFLKGRVCQERGQLENAKGAFDEALAIYGKTSDAAGQVKVLCALSALSLLESDKQGALEFAEQAVRLSDEQWKRAVGFAEEVVATELRWPACLAAARAERALGKKERALKSYSLAIDRLEAIWWAVYVVTETSAIAFRETAQAAYLENVDLLMEQDSFKDAYELADQAKARTLLTFNGARRAAPRSESSKEAATQRELSRSIARLREQLLSSHNRQQQAMLQKDIAVAEYRIHETRLQSEMEHTRERWVWSKLATAAELQKQMADDRTTLAQFSLGERRSFLWLFTGGELYSAILPPRREIENQVKSYLDLLATAPNRLYIDRDLAKLTEQSQKLFATLFGRLSAKIPPQQRLIIVADGLLRYLPFEALIYNKNYLVENHEISYSHSASMLVQSLESGGQAEAGDRMELLAFGDPIFGTELRESATRKPRPGAIGAIANGSTLRASGARKPRTGAIGLILNRRGSDGFRLPALPRSRDEVQYITGLFPADRTRLFVGKDSTEAAFKRESLRRYRRLHFATHSLIDEVSPSRSAVVLTLNSDFEEDGFLDVNEISELDLDCDLVVLSACQTGRGQMLSGEGIVGLSRAFLYAGARSVLVSLWSVSDISTAQLMGSFYRNLTTGIGNAAALRETKLRMLKSDKEIRHPYYWAPFVIVGKP